MAGLFDQMAGMPNNSDQDTECQTQPVEPQEQVAEQGRTPVRLREAAQELLKHGLLEESRKPNIYRRIISNSQDIDGLLEPLDLSLGLDEVRGLAFVRVRQSDLTEQDDWSHPLVRRQRLNLEQSLLVAILRQHFVAYEQDSGTGASEAVVAIDELIPQLQIYLGDLGSDARERTRAVNLLDQLKGHGLVSTIDAHDRVGIRPIITHLANPENLQALLQWLRDQARDEHAGEGDT